MLGRFIQPDSIIPDVYSSQSLNPYAYVLNNPLRYVDPAGYAPEEIGHPGDAPDLTSPDAPVPLDKTYDGHALSDRERKDISSSSIGFESGTAVISLNVYEDSALQTPMLDPIDLIAGFVAGGILAVRSLVGVGFGSKGTTVIGHLPEYVEVAKKMGANYLKPTSNWNWRMQGEFIKGVIQRGDDVFIGTSVREGPSVLKHEIKQLVKAGYEPVEQGGRWLIKEAK